MAIRNSGLLFKFEINKNTKDIQRNLLDNHPGQKKSLDKKVKIDINWFTLCCVGSYCLIGS